MQIATLKPEHSAYRPGMQLAYPDEMTNGSPRQVRRRENLRRLIGDEPGAQAQLGLEIGTPKSHISAILAGRRGVGDSLAQKIEQHFSLPPGALDSDPAADGYPPEVAALAAELAALPHRQRDVVLRLIRSTVTSVRQAITDGLVDLPAETMGPQPRTGRSER